MKMAKELAQKAFALCPEAFGKSEVSAEQWAKAVIEYYPMWKESVSNAIEKGIEQDFDNLDYYVYETTDHTMTVEFSINDQEIDSWEFPAAESVE